jgi:LemA protein
MARLSRGNPLKFPLSRGLALASLAAVSISLAGCGVNAIPTKEEAAKASWANVQAAYQRRSDLIPNLVSTVQAYAKQERGVLDEVTQARASATHVSVDASTITNPAQFQQFEQAQDKLSGVLGRFTAIQERYPELTSNANFMALQSELEGTENRINIARRDYNASVQDYNVTLHTFPGVLWASTVYHDEKPMQLFAATSDAQSAPKVSFDIAPPAGSASTSTTTSSSSSSTTKP